MPEGNEIHRHAELQNKTFVGVVVRVAAPNGRFEDGARLLDRRKLRAVDGFGKHLFYDFGKDRQLHIHLGLYGKFRNGEMPFPEPAGALRIRISSTEHWLELRGPTACDVLTNDARRVLLARIGSDPLRPDADVEEVVTRITRSRSPIGGLLMDQSVIGGLGNIYRAELLYRARISPFIAGSDVSQAQIRMIWEDAIDLMKKGMVDRRIVTTRPADRPHSKGEARRFETHYVYRRKGLPCFVCGTQIAMREFVGRKLYWCPTCQKETQRFCPVK